MDADVVRVTPLDLEVAEEWVRRTAEPDVLGASASKGAEDPIWRVALAVAEFLRRGPLETEMCDEMRKTLGGVPGVTAVVHEDREEWVVFGAPSREHLVKAAAAVADSLAERARAHIASV